MKHRILEALTKTIEHISLLALTTSVVLGAVALIVALEWWAAVLFASIFAINLIFVSKTKKHG